MVDNFTVIYKILREFDAALDKTEFDANAISAGALGITEIRLRRYLEMLCDAGYIKGVNIVDYNDKTFRVSFVGASITLKGLEYLADNTVIKKACEFLKTAKEIIPFV